MSERYVVDGIDAGRSGAAVRLLGTPGGRTVSVLAAASWRPSGTGFRVTAWTPGGLAVQTKARRHELVTEVLWAEQPNALVTEDVFMGRSIRGSMRLARYAQMEASACHLHWHPVVVVERQILESHWRRALGVPPSKRDKVDVIPALMARFIPSLAPVATALGATPHLFDAAALAYLGLQQEAWDDAWVQRTAPPSKRRRGKRR